MHFVRRFRTRPHATGPRTAARRSALGFGVFGLGVLLLVMVPLTRWFVLPRVEVAPLNINVTDVSTGQGSYFDAHSLHMVGPVPLTVTRHLIGDVAAGTATGDAVWNISTKVDTADSLRLGDPRFALTWTVERWVFDRKTNLPVHCCGETPRFQGDAYLKFPFNVSKGGTYQFWSSTAQRAFPVHYTGEQTVHGQQLYRFQGTLAPTRTVGMDVPASLVGLPAEQGLVHVDEYFRDDGTEVLVDPLSGTPVGGFQHPRITLRLPGSDQDRATVFSATFTSTDASEQGTLQVAEQGDRQLQLVRSVLPTTDLVLGGICLVLGVLLLIRAARLTPPRTVEPAEEVPV